MCVTQTHKTATGSALQEAQPFLVGPLGPPYLEALGPPDYDVLVPPNLDALGPPGCRLLAPTSVMGPTSLDASLKHLGTAFGFGLHDGWGLWRGTVNAEPLSGSARSI